MSRITDYGFLFQTTFGTSKTNLVNNIQLSQMNSSSVQKQLKAAGIDTNSKKYKAALSEMMKNGNGAMFTNVQAIKNLMSQYDKNGDWIDPNTGLTGLAVTDENRNSYKHIISIPESSREEMFELAKKEFLNENGTLNGDTTKRESVYNNLYRKMDKDDRLSAGWTMEQYHKLERDLDGVKNANCMAHARRHFANAIKAIGKSNPEAVEASVAYKALLRIGAIYNLEGALKNLSAEERLKERQSSIKPLVEEFFTWLRKIQADRSVLPKSETAKGINYCLNQEAYLKVFLSDGEVPIDNLASERALRTFTIGRKNWMTINTVRGADASAIIYSVTETARANCLNVYYYMKHLLTELTQTVRADGSIDEKDLKPLMPWSKDLPAECYKRRK